MTDGDALLEAIRLAPDDDALRLVYADWLEESGDGQRAEFIRAQVMAEACEEGSAEWERLTARAEELLAVNVSAWLAGCWPVDRATTFRFRRAEYAAENGLVVSAPLRDGPGAGRPWNVDVVRGFVDEVEMSPELFLSLAPGEICPVGPAPTLRLKLLDSGWGREGESLESLAPRIAESPELRHFEGVVFYGMFTSVGDGCLRAVAAQPDLATRVRGLRLSEDQVGDDSVLPLLRNPRASGWRALDLDFTRCSGAVVDAIVETDRFRRLTYLDLSGVGDGRNFRRFGSPGRWPRLKILKLGGCRLCDLSVRGLMRPGAFPRVRCLDLHANDVSAVAVRALLMSGAFPQLKLLGLVNTLVSQAQVAELRDEFGGRLVFNLPERRTR